MQGSNACMGAQGRTEGNARVLRLPAGVAAGQVGVACTATKTALQDSSHQGRPASLPQGGTCVLVGKLGLLQHTVNIRVGL